MDLSELFRKQAGIDRPLADDADLPPPAPEPENVLTREIARLAENSLKERLRQDEYRHGPLTSRDDAGSLMVLAQFADGFRVRFMRSPGSTSWQRVALGRPKPATAGGKDGGKHG